MVNNIYQHFSQDDQDFLDKSMELLQRVEDQYSFESTAFLNPHQVAILKNLSKQYDVQVFSSSDYFPSEFAKVLIAPSYYQLDVEDFDLALLEIVYASKFYKVSHSQIMGTLLHQLGIERRTFGDIIVVDDRAQVFVDRRLEEYFITNVSKIAKVPVRLKKVSLTEQLQNLSATKTRDVLVSSLRLDKLVATVFKLSRSQAVELIMGKQVKQNYRTIDNPSQQIALGELISVRKYGRFKVLTENGFSKNGKHKLTVELLPSK